eukprot:COSAG02_NODE_12712_length_1505_cov_1.335704_1_plen_85_part_00
MSGPSRLALPLAVLVGNYVPFELLAKATLIIAAICFVANPFPNARFFAVGAVAVVNVLATVKSKWENGRAEMEKEIATEAAKRD